MQSSCHSCAPWARRKRLNGSDFNARQLADADLPGGTGAVFGAHCFSTRSDSLELARSIPVAAEIAPANVLGLLQLRSTRDRWAGAGKHVLRSGTCRRHPAGPRSVRIYGGFLGIAARTARGA